MKPFLFFFTTLLLLTGSANAQWSAVRFDSTNTFLKVYAVTGNNAFFIAQEPSAYDCFFLRTNDGGITFDSIWLSPTGTTYNLEEIFFTDIDTGFLGGRTNNVNELLLKTVDNGTTWTDITPNPSANEPITGISFLNGMEGYVTNGFFLYSTTDGGTTWSIDSLPFYATDIRFTSLSTGFASGNSQLSSDGVVMKTTNGGQTWTQLLIATDPDLFMSILSKLDRVNASVIYTNLLYTNILYRSINNGASWVSLVVDSVSHIADFDFISLDTGHIVSWDGEIFVTYDGGISWTLEYATEWGFYGPSVFLRSIAFIGEEGYVCGSNGLIKRHEDITTGITETSGTETSVLIYPNPVESGTGVTIKVNASGGTNVSIFSATGQLVFQQNNMNTAGGSITLPAMQLAPGMYTVKLAGSERASFSKLLIR